MAKNEPTKSVADLLKDSNLSNELPKVPKKIDVPEKLSLKHLLMMNAFQVFVTKLINDMGNASVMVRKEQYSKVEISNIIRLTQMVGESYDEMVENEDI